MKDWLADDPPAIVPPVVKTPLLGLSHSKFGALVMAEKFPEKVPPLGPNAGYMRPRFSPGAAE